MHTCLALVIPMYNEHALCGQTAQELLHLCEDLSLPGGFELIFSDDGSTDDSADIIRAAAEKDTRIRLVTAPHNCGKGAAVRRGILASTADVVLFTDCDLAFGTEQIAALFAFHRSTGAALTLGCRAMHPHGYDGYTPLRHLASRVFLHLGCLLSGIHVRDAQTGLKCLDGTMARKLFSLAQLNGYAFDWELLMLAKHFRCSIRQFPVYIARSDASLSRTSHVHLLHDACTMLRDVVAARRRIHRFPHN